MILDRSEMFKALAAETRVRIVELLKAQGPLCGRSIAEMINLTPSAVSQHLRTLRQADLVTKERSGYHVPYSLNKDALENLRRYLTEVLTHAKHKKLKRKEIKLGRLSLNLLKKYESELKSELKNIRKEIKEKKSEHF